MNCAEMDGAAGSVESYEATPGGDADGLGPARDLELLEEMSEMRFDRALRDLQGGGDLLVAVAVGQEAQRSKLARRELHLRDPLGQLGGGGRSQVGLAGQHVADARHEGVSGNVLEDVRLRARLQRPRDVFIGIVRRQYHD